MSTAELQQLGRQATAAFAAPAAPSVGNLEQRSVTLIDIRDPKTLYSILEEHRNVKKCIIISTVVFVCLAVLIGLTAGHVIPPFEGICTITGLLVSISLGMAYSNAERDILEMDVNDYRADISNPKFKEYSASFPPQMPIKDFLALINLYKCNCSQQEAIENTNKEKTALLQKLNPSAAL